MPVGGKAELDKGLWLETGHIVDGAVTSAKIADDAVMASKIPDSTITAAKLATNAVESDKIKDDAVTSIKIITGAIIADKIADGMVSMVKTTITRHTVLVAIGQTAGSATVPVNSLPIGIIPTSNQDQLVDSVVVSGTTLTVTLAAAATAENAFKVTTIT